MDFYVSGDVAPGGRFKFCYDTTGAVATGEPEKGPSKLALQIGAIAGAAAVGAGAVAAAAIVKKKKDNADKKAAEKKENS